MGKKKRFSRWITVFAGGKQVDSSGAEHDDCDGIIDKAVDTFDPVFHEPPVTIGHPEHDKPAWGWVSAVREFKEVVAGKKVKVLQAKFRDADKNFLRMLKEKKFKKRSAAFYNDGRLRHVAFLGAVPPAVKGLPDPKFADGDSVSFSFSEEEQPDKKGMIKKIDDHIFSEKKQEEPEEKKPDRSTEDNNEETEGGEKMPKFTEAEVNEKVKKAAEEGEARGRAAAFAESQKQQGKTKIATYLATPIKDGGPVPALVDAGLGTFLECLDNAKTFEFSDGEDKETPLDFFIDHVAPMIKGPKFGEHASRGDAPPDLSNETGAELAARASEYRFAEKQKGREISHRQAVQELVSKEAK